MEHVCPTSSAGTLYPWCPACSGLMQRNLVNAALEYWWWWRYKQRIVLG